MPPTAQIQSLPVDTAADDVRTAPAGPPRVAILRRDARRFFRAPQSASAAVAAVLEPALHIATLMGAHRLAGLPMDRGGAMLALLVILLTFPGTDRTRMAPWRSLVDILGHWAWLVAIVLMCAWVTASLGAVDAQVFRLWLVGAPLAQWGATLAGHALLRAGQPASRARHRAVVVGGGALGITAAQALARRADDPVDVVGYFDDRHGERLHAIALGQRLGRLDEVARYVDKLGIREVYITLPMASQPRMVALIDSLRQTTASIFFVPDVFSIDIVQGRLQDVNGLPVVGLCETPFTGINALVKRVSDVVIASAVLVLAAPLMAAIAVGIKLDSRGPVLFRQRRNGLDGEEIIVWKFRTMTTADNGATVRQATRDDGRVTRFGAVLRRTSLDELPQFVNVLQGRMSVVGPRPHAVAHNTQYRALIKGYMVRHKARPGVTGWAQVNGYRGETDTLDKMQGRVECDLEYLRNWSLGLDLAIIARTVRLIAFDGRAY